MERDLTLREALAEDRLDDFVRQEEDKEAQIGLSPPRGFCGALRPLLTRC